MNRATGIGLVVLLALPPLAAVPFAGPGGLLVLGSTAGSAAMALLWLNSWCAAALPLCWLAAALVLLRPRRPAPTPPLQPRG